MLFEHWHKRSGASTVLCSRHSSCTAQPPYLPQAHAVITSCLAGRVERYPMSESAALEQLIRAAPQLTNEELYKQSLQIEPRGRYS